MSIAVCVLLCISLHALKADSNSCTSGFMELDLIMKRAEKIPDGEESPNELKDGLRFVPGWNFTCSSNITSLLLGVEIEEEEDHAPQYPEVQIWRKVAEGDQYRLIDSRMIVMNAGSYNPGGVLRYEINPPLSVEANDVLGVYQPSDAVVELYFRNNDLEAPIAYVISGRPTIISTTIATILSQQYVLLSVITDDPQCSNGFLDFEALRSKVLDVNINEVTRRERELRIFPDIRFTCNGSLTKWMLGGETNINAGAELQIWRNMGQDKYSLVGTTVLSVGTHSVGLLEELPDTPLEFMEGDILGVYQQQGVAINRVYYQESTGPANYQYPANVNSNPPLNLQEISRAVLNSDYDYPLVTVEIVQVSGDAVAVSPTKTSNSETPSMSSEIPSMSLLTMPMSSMTTPNVVIIITAMLLIIVSVIVVTVVILIFWWRRKRQKDNIVQQSQDASTDCIELHYNASYSAAQNTTIPADTESQIQHNDSNATYDENMQSNEPEYATIKPLNDIDDIEYLQHNVSYVPSLPIDNNQQRCVVYIHLPVAAVDGNLTMLHTQLQQSILHETITRAQLQHTQQSVQSVSPAAGKDITVQLDPNNIPAATEPADQESDTSAD